MALGVLISLGVAKVVAIATVATVTMRKRAVKLRKKEQKTAKKKKT
jgi:hypothetical protein